MEHTIIIGSLDQDTNQSNSSINQSNSLQHEQNLNQDGRRPSDNLPRGDTEIATDVDRRKPHVTPVDSSKGSGSSSSSFDPSSGSSSQPSDRLFLTDYNLCSELREATIKGNVDGAKRLFQQKFGVNYVEKICVIISNRDENVLHVAAGANRIDFVKQMIDMLNTMGQDRLRQHLESKTSYGNTAFCLATMAGGIEIADTMFRLHPNLLRIRGGQEMTALYLAALYGEKEMALYLYKKMNNGQGLTVRDKLLIFFVSIDTTLYDLALKLLKDNDANNELVWKACWRDTNPSLQLTPLHPLAQRPLHLWDKTSESHLLTEALELVECIWVKLLAKYGAGIENYIKKHKDLLFDAAHLGNYKFLEKLIRLYPDLVHEEDDDGRSIFHIAIRHRHANLFNIIYKIGFKKQLIAASLDRHGNSLLHLAAEYKDPEPVNKMPGAALQMQEELKTFEEVKSLLKPSYIELKNNDGKTPRQLFTAEHKDLLTKGEEWMRNTAAQCMLVATIICSVIFAAAFSGSGGNDDNGKPINLRLFSISEALTLSFSSISIVVFLSILASRYTENDFLNSLPFKLIAGVITLSLSIATMMLAFISNFFLSYNHQNAIPITSSILVAVPVVIFVWLKFGLLKDIFHLSFGFRFSTKSKKC